MGQALRAAGETLRRKYARVFGVPVADVQFEELEDDDVIVWCPPFPKWSTGPVVRPGFERSVVQVSKPRKVK